MIRRIDRYVLGEVVGPLLLGFVIYTSILLLQFLFNSAKMIIVRGVPAGQVGELLLYSLPSIVVLTVPMSLLFGILVAVGRLTADSELTALRASGVSLFSLYRPILLISGVLFAVNVLVMLFALPAGNHALQQLRFQILTQNVSGQVEPRVFYEEWEGLVLYVFDKEPGSQERWRGVFVAEDLPGNLSRVTVAERGEVRLDEGADRLVLRLENAIVHDVEFQAPDQYETKGNKVLYRVLEDEFSSGPQFQVRASKGLREQGVLELREQARNPNLPPELRNLTLVEVHKKFSIPAACIVFGLLGLPLGFSNQRGGGRSSGFALSIGVIIVYYIAIANGEEAARVGRMAPWLSMWLPNLGLTAAGLFLLARRNRDKSLLLSRVDRWLRNRPASRRRQREAPPTASSPDGAEATGPESLPAGSIVLRLPRLRLRFPNLLDRYIVRLYSWTFLLVMLSASAIYLIADLTDRIDEILTNQIPSEVVVDYYKYLTLQVGYEVAPIAILVTTLISFGILSRTNEIIAAKALGISLYRLAVPVVVLALLVSAGAIVFESRILPVTNGKVAQLKDRIKGAAGVRTYRRADRQWLFGQGRYIYNYQRYDGDQQALQRLQVFEFDDQYRLTRRLFADEARFVGSGWIFEDSWVRSFEKGAHLEYEKFAEPVVVDYPETPEYFESEFKLPEAMSYPELDDYLKTLRASGQTAPDLEVELQKKIAFPLVSLIMALVALPFSFRLGRRGALYGIGLGVVLGIVYFGLFAFFSTLGETGALPPSVAVWSPNIAFALCSLYLFLGLET